MNCDLIAPYYRWLELAAFGSALASRRRYFLPALARARRALIMGDGDGSFLRDLLLINPHVHADYIDLSAAMLQRARQQMETACGGARVTYHLADALTHPLPARHYDAIATHFFLDCFEPPDLAAMIARIHAAAAPGAYWAISEFRVPTGALAVPARGLIASMYAFFALTTGLRTRCLTDHRPIVEAAGFTLVDASLRLRGLVSSELWVMTP